MVQLGSQELTAGIPGDGDLTAEQIQAWLADPKNHIPLSVTLPAGLAASATSVYIPEDNPMTKAKIELGRQLYFDKRLSSDNTVSCADCHHPDEGYSRHTQFGVGIDGQEGNRNSPVSYNRIVSRAQFWDGRAGSLEAQAIGPIANPIEMGNTHDKAVATVAGIEGYQQQFKSIFGGDVDIEKIGKAIATFERAVVTGPSAYDLYEPLRAFEMAFADELEDLDELKEEEPDVYDRYQMLLANAKTNPMSESARRGREIFFSDRGACTACHSGANFSDEKYHNLGIGMDAEKPDLGRFAETQEEKDKGAFKTPTVRNVVQSAPYMHDGSLKTLEDVVEWYAKGGHPNPYLSPKMKKLNLSDQDKADLVEFMKACTGALPPVEMARLPQ
ncbi:MAG TPA: cytochrome-c peroxidase [Planctomycetaceae bacterium]|nr:cytochrome-c peroxidase [Planctomycetaceae bacterium]